MLTFGVGLQFVGIGGDMVGESLLLSQCCDVWGADPRPVTSFCGFIPKHLSYRYGCIN